MELDHVVVWVTDPRVALGFYRDLLGLPTYREEAYLRGEVPFPSVRLSPVSILDLTARALAERVRRLVGERVPSAAGQPINHLCLAVDKSEFDQLLRRLGAAGVPVVQSGRQNGARGECADSFYLQDPDGNVIEIRHYA
jgi:glyoxylase I family protein